MTPHQDNEREQPQERTREERLLAEAELPPTRSELVDTIRHLIKAVEVLGSALETHTGARPTGPAYTEVMAEALAVLAREESPPVRPTLDEVRTEIVRLQRRVADLESARRPLDATARPPR